MQLRAITWLQCDPSAHYITLQALGGQVISSLMSNQAATIEWVGCIRIAFNWHFLSPIPKQIWTKRQRGTCSFGRWKVVHGDKEKRQLTPSGRLSPSRGDAIMHPMMLRCVMTIVGGGVGAGFSCHRPKKLAKLMNRFRRETVVEAFLTPVQLATDSQSPFCHQDIL